MSFPHCSRLERFRLDWMKVCLVTSAYRPYLSGVSEHVHNLALSLYAHGHEVHILTTCYPNLEPVSPTPDAQVPSFAVTRVGRALILPAHGGHFTLSVGLRLASQVKRFLTEQQPDVVHCHGIFPPEISYWAARYAASPTVVTFHTVSPRTPSLLRSAFRACFAGLGRKVAARIAVSRACADWAQGWFLEDCAVIPNGVNTHRFSPSVSPRPELTSCPSILYVSRIDKRKGLPVLLRSLREVRKEIPDVKLFVIGSGPLEAPCRQLCLDLHLQGSVVFCGFIPPDELPAWYAGCTVFCAPSLGPESMGIILIEAMACARPVVASRISGYDEVIAHGRNGLLFPAGDRTALTYSLLSVLKSTDEQTRLGREALRDAQQYSWSNIAKRVEQVYNRVLHRT